MNVALIGLGALVVAALAAVLWPGGSPNPPVEVVCPTSGAKCSINVEATFDLLNGCLLYSSGVVIERPTQITWVLLNHSGLPLKFLAPDGVRVQGMTGLSPVPNNPKGTFTLTGFLGPPSGNGGPGEAVFNVGANVAGIGVHCEPINHLNPYVKNRG